MWRWVGITLSLGGLLLLAIAAQTLPKLPTLERHHQLSRKLLVLSEQVLAQRDRLSQGLLSEDPAEAETLLRSARNYSLGSIPAALAAAESEARDLFRSDETGERDRIRRVLENLARLPNGEQILAQRIQSVVDGTADGSMTPRDVTLIGREMLVRAEEVVQLVTQATQLAQMSLGVAVLLSETAAERATRRLDWLLGLAGVCFVIAALAVSVERRKQHLAEQALQTRITESRATLAESEQQNLTLQRSAQAERRTSLELALVRLEQRSFTESIRSALVIMDEQSIVRSANHAARRMFQMDDSSIGRSLFAVEGLQRALEHLGGKEVFASKLLMGGEKLDAPEVELDAQYIALGVTPYFDEAGKMRGAIFVADDITEQVESRKRLMLSERLAAMGRMSAQVAHEIRNPLSALSLNADLLADEIPGGEDSEARQLLRAIVREVERLTAVTDEYLRLARHRAPALQREDLATVIAELCGFMGEELRHRGIVTELNLEHAPAYVWIDAGQARQALLNVLKNALEAMPTGGTIRIDLTQEADQYVLTVRDQGTGIPQAALQRIFDPFYTTKEGGTGLGLPITQQIIADHGGEVTCESAEGRGTTMRVRLPVATTQNDGLSADEFV